MKKVFKLEGCNNKTTIIQEGDISTLVSYKTEVARYNHKTNKMDVKSWYSQTTMKHINKFLELYGFDRCSKKELEEKYLAK